MERDLRMRENRQKSRAHGRGRGGPSRGGPPGKPHSPRRSAPIPDQDRFLPPSDSADGSLALRRATGAACSRPLPSVPSPPDSPFSDEDAAAFAQILAGLSLDDQVSLDFLVDVAPLERRISQPDPARPVRAAKPQPPTAARAASHAKKEPDKDLNSWLDDLLS
jgi:hypothetical protein